MIWLDNIKRLNVRNFINHAKFTAAVLNGQEHAEGASEILEDGRVFYILNISGTGITIKDKNDVTIRTFQSQIEFCHPIEIVDGFKISGTNVGATYIRV